MTLRLYHQAADLLEFTAQVVEQLTLDDKPAVILDQTAFYPTAGGQPHDTGYLNDRQVLEVVADKERGAIIHLLDGPLTAPTVSGKVDWPRRFDHMQQHSAQHLLSQTLYLLGHFETVSMRIGAAETTVDFDTPTLTEQQIDEAERYANQLIAENRPIKIYEVAEAQLPTIPLRRPPAVSGHIRIVEIADFDYSACGGTHCRSTAEIGPIKLLRTERIRGIVRLVFKAGQRAQADYAAKHRLLSALAEQFSVNPDELPETITRQQAQIKALQKQVALLSQANLRYEAQALLEQAEVVDGVKIVSHIFHERAVAEVKSLAATLQDQPLTIILLGGIAHEKLSLVYARSADLDLDMGAILHDSLAQFGGRGGGKPDFAQGGAPDARQGEAIMTNAKQGVLALTGKR